MLGIEIKKETRREKLRRKAKAITDKFFKQRNDMKLDPTLALLVMKILSDVFIAGACIISHKESISAIEAAEKYCDMIKEEIIETIKEAQKTPSAKEARENYLRHVKA